MTAAEQITYNYRGPILNSINNIHNTARGDDMLEKIVAYVMENFAEEITLEDMSSTVGISRFSLCRAFQRRFKVTPMRWLWNFRAILAFEFIALEPRWSLTDIAFSCGFTSSAHFSRFFKATFKCSPSQHRMQSLVALRASGNTGKRPVEFDSVFKSEGGIVQRVAKSAMELTRQKEVTLPEYKLDVARGAGVSLQE